MTDLWEWIFKKSGSFYQWNAIQEMTNFNWKLDNKATKLTPHVPFVIVSSKVDSNESEVSSSSSNVFVFSTHFEVNILKTRLQ